MYAQNSTGSFAKFVTFTCSTGIANGFAINAPGGQWKLQGNVVQMGIPGDSFCSIALLADDNDVVRNQTNAPFCVLNGGNTIVNNTANGGADGIVVFVGANDNELHSNTTNNNTFVGIEIQTMNNDITGNTSLGNGTFDLFEGNPNCDNNRWEGNHFNTTNQPQCVK